MANNKASSSSKCPTEGIEFMILGQDLVYLPISYLYRNEAGVLYVYVYNGEQADGVLGFFLS